MDFLYTHENLYFGSDVVDLDTEKDRSFLQLQRYTKKICTDFELTNLANSKTDLEFEHKLWQIWSLKESSYKASQRKQGERRFKYRDFIVSPDFETVTDCHSDLQLSATTLQLKTAILSVVYFEDQNSISRDVSLIQKNHNRPVIVTWLDSSFQNQSDSSAVRQQLKEILLQFFGIEPDYYT
ncbi:MAG: 4-phosphopantetheinyl transferase family protein, partial [Leptonema sp. (in: Bacteria)]|nr:4-phosphopantetheinyl transferase family protein [Leptonema sp. (in: bacteria)]